VFDWHVVSLGESGVVKRTQLSISQIISHVKNVLQTQNILSSSPRFGESHGRCSGSMVCENNFLGMTELKMQGWASKFLSRLLKTVFYMHKSISQI